MENIQKLQEMATAVDEQPDAALAELTAFENDPLKPQLAEKARSVEMTARWSYATVHSFTESMPDSLSGAMLKNMELQQNLLTAGMSMYAFGFIAGAKAARE